MLETRAPGFVARLWIIVSVATLLTGMPVASAVGDEPISFTKQVAPVLVKHCLACHGPKDYKGSYQLHTFEALMKAGESETSPVAAGKIDESYLFELLSSTDTNVLMPKEGDRLPDAQLALVRRWIEEGAKFDSPDPAALLSSIIPKEPYPAAPVAYRVAIPVTALAFRPDGQELAIGGYHEITIWNPTDGQLLRRIGNIAERTYGLTYSPDGSMLAAASGTPGQVGEVKLINPNDGALIKDLGTLSDVAFDVAFSPDGKRLAACGADRSIRVYDVASGKQEVLIEDHADWVLAITWSPDGKWLASASRDKTAKVFDAATGDSQVTYPGHGETVYGVAFGPEGKEVLSVGGDKQIQVWNPADGKKASNTGGYGREIYKIFRVGDRLVTCSADKTARIYNAADRKQLFSFGGHNDWVYTVGYNPATKRVATGSYDGEVRIWNAEDGKELFKFKAAPGLAETAEK